MQSGVLVGAAPYGLPLKHKILPQFLNDLGYKSVAVGKWHLGKSNLHTKQKCFNDWSTPYSHR